MTKEQTVENQLDKCYEFLLRIYPERNKWDFYQLWLEEIIDLCFLFQYDAIRKKSEKLLTLNLRLRRILKKEELEKKYRSKTHFEYLEDIKKYSDLHIQLALLGQYKDAIEKYKRSVDLEEIAETLTLLHKFEEADYVVTNYLKDEIRINSVRVIQVIEYARFGDWRKSEKVLDTINFSIDGGEPWTRLLLIRGLLGLVPYEDYPFPDY